MVITEDKAQLIAQQIADNLNKRSGFDLYSLDSAIRHNIINEWKQIILKEINDK